MDNRQVMKAFNDHFVEFLDDIQRVFPNDTDIATVRNSLLAMRKANPKLIISSFKECVAGLYHDEIERGDLEFFINKDYGDDLGNGGTSNAVLDKIDVLREPVRQMNKNDQNKAIKYIQNLTKLCDLYN
jgi:hypothetical protein